MRNLLVSAVLCLAACGGDDADPHVVGACTGWVDNQGTAFTGQCEAACMTPPASTGQSCDTTKQLNCMKFSFSGVQGCCIEDGQGTGTTIRFYECAP
jgi:hypothetical protein